MRVNLDESSYNDPRFRRLARLLGIHVDAAIGYAGRLWLAALNRVDDSNPEGLLTRADAEDSTDHRELVERMIEVDLVVQRRGGKLYFSGLKERAGFLLKQRENGKGGGRPRKNGALSKPVGYGEETHAETQTCGNESLLSGSVSVSGSVSGSFLDPDPECRAEPDVPVPLVLSIETPKAEPAARRQTASFLEWFNRKFQRQFTLTNDLVRMVKALNTRGYSEKPDIRGVALYLRDEWQDDPKMAKYLRPDSILVAEKFGVRLDLAKERYPDIWNGGEGSDS